MGNQDEQFCLKWNDFQQCIKSTFQDLREEKDFMDVTLCCDGETIRAHKVILSACSITFRNLLKKNPSQNPTILLWDVLPRDLSAILDFMYNGEVNVKQEHLNSFLSVAEKLRVRGLCQNDPKPPAKDPKSSRPRSTAPRPDKSETPSAKRAKLDSAEEAAAVDGVDDDVQEIAAAAPLVKEEKLDALAARAGGGFGAAAAPPQAVQLVDSYSTEEYGAGESEDYGEYYEEEANYGVDPVDQSQTGKGLTCNACGKQFSRLDVLKTHIRDLHLNAGITFSCDYCGKSAKSLNALKVHTSIYHRNMRRDSK